MLYPSKIQNVDGSEYNTKSSSFEVCDWNYPFVCNHEMNIGVIEKKVSQ